MRALLPNFHESRVERMHFSLAWPAADLTFEQWRTKARARYLDCLLAPPPHAAFSPQVIGEEDRGGYVARKVALNISADNRIMTYLLLPKGEGPFPAMIALHDHGAHFSIGKEKVVRPFAESAERLTDAQAWVDKYYGGRYIGDELAKRGYVVFATDAMFWGDRGRQEGVEYAEQQALAANMIQLGMSWAGTIVWDDMRSAEFVQGLAEVDPARVGCMGLSMGAHRAWSLAAATDIIKAGAAICWMGDTPTLMSEGNNQTRGQSAFSMIHPGLRNHLDYPDVASIACPKPMLFFNGTEDGLFPVPGVEAAYQKMRRVWRDGGVEDRLVTKLWPVPHEFNAAMQDEAFAWLDQQFMP
ncbi:MAG: dienelactone hydrolase family protein [Candidatus Hydrogenedentes bacterium]|nr:dienelactone hydrolase family protein [Candidatus Hydrogenedentota bacterium]